MRMPPSSRASGKADGGGRLGAAAAAGGGRGSDLNHRAGTGGHAKTRPITARSPMVQLCDARNWMVGIISCLLLYSFVLAWFLDGPDPDLQNSGGGGGGGGRALAHYSAAGWSDCAALDCVRSEACNAHRADLLPQGKECCADVLADMLHSVSDVLDRHHLVHYAAYGTALGVHRDLRVIPWTGDVDLVLPRESFDRLTSSQDAVGDLKRAGYLFFHDHVGRVCAKPGPGRPRSPKRDMMAYIDKYPYLDMYVEDNSPSESGSPSSPSSSSSGHVVIQIPGAPNYFDPKTIYPLRRVKMLHNSTQRIPVPAKMDEYLERIYGADYLTPPLDADKRLHD